jgi:diaminohydroxyphosphoribosylaminopyrimidine deaminase / 5-amino-6-(5-phosphoribosylamino)uracil reductase
VSKPLVSHELIAAAFTKAVAAAHSFRGMTSPNPPVGCVLLDEVGETLAIAAHQRAGLPHAEALAIEACRAAGTFDRISVAVVTLEPCNHTGRTPPCAAALLKTPVRDVWIGCADPNPNVAGGGAEYLKANGIAVTFIQDARIREQCVELVRPFAKHARTGLPWVTVKQALQADGSMIPPKGEKTFTSPSSITLAHELRKRADAVLTGSGTVLADNPHFTVRSVPDHPGKRRVLVILDRRKRVPLSYIEASQKRCFDVWISHSIEDALKRLGSVGVLEVLVEGGPLVTDAILASAIWDEHVVIRQDRSQNQPDHITRSLRIV